ncbi:MULTISPECIES: hypothetical protein [Actinokineospora]|uniref:Uncharacterized protein n=1 Tax=Actinokineospora fastidiosa TaxID=1816 RepID=A0A918GEU7_9PSEU|nr:MULTISPECIES: hypothetical protein [Actinokineospora]UVS79896.1 hypothetical protein Actkin_03646 [Actinokineospora sp. UTMC 2448]GGS31606.1 hypothetical protein GCM10010171_26860 [Actinokineospora fastidiosa]
MSTIAMVLLVIGVGVAVGVRAERSGPLRTDPVLAERTPPSPLGVDGFAPVRERTGDEPGDRLSQAFRVSEGR